MPGICCFICVSRGYLSQTKKGNPSCHDSSSYSRAPHQLFKPILSPLLQSFTHDYRWYQINNGVVHVNDFLVIPLTVSQLPFPVHVQDRKEWRIFCGEFLQSLEWGGVFFGNRDKIIQVSLFSLSHNLWSLVKVRGLQISLIDDYLIFPE